MDRRAWLVGIGHIIDAMDHKKFSELMTEDGVFRFGNMPPVVGRQAISDTVEQFWLMIKGSEHEVVNFWEGPDSVVWQGSVLYTRKDDRKVPVNFTNVLYMDGDLIKQYLIYIDNGPLFAE